MKKLSKKDTVYLSIIALLVTIVITVGLVLGLPSDDEENPFVAYYDSKCSSYAVQNSNLSKEQIVFIGDSITDLCPLDDYYADLPLACYNRGIGGDTTDGVLNRLQVSIFDLKPQKVVLMIGTNDVDGGKSEDYIINNYIKIVEQIKNELPTVELYCMSIIPQNEVFGASSGLNITENNQKIQRINARIKALSDEKGAIFVDIYYALLGENDSLDTSYSDDGLHLNASGFTVWADIVKPYLA